ncbi:restriction endonuclease subunit S [Zoogloea sp.]|uniref:restriction endonuclease subunit S n=1 Tax=Zoogloea sp. TaxID=49181 RepID=UPI0035B0DCD4
MTIDANELPRGWATSKLDEITTAVSTNGKKVKTKDAHSTGEFPVIDQGAAECAGYLDDESLVIHASLDHPIVLFGDHTRIVKYIQRDFIPGADGTKLLQAKSGIQPKYLHYLVAAAEVPDRGYGRHFHHLKEIELPVAPAAEQKRIADKLDTVFTRVDAVNTRLARVAPILKRFRQSVLAAATSGRLTEGWRDASPTTPAWSQTTVGAIETDLRYGTSKKCSVEPVGSAVLRIPNIGSDGGPELNDLKYAEFDLAEQAKLALRAGDLLIIRSNGSVDLVGKCCVVNEQAAGMLFAGYLMRLRMDAARALPKFVYLALSSPSHRALIERTAKSTSGVNNINSEELRSLPLHLPPLEEQAEIVRRVETLFAFADRLEARLQTAQTATERLTPALLAKAFRGELVPQDPNDEPASELLRRLQQEAPSTSTKRGRKSAA